MKTLIVYHSNQGNTEHVVRAIAENLNADVIKLNSGQRNINTALLTTHRVVSQLIRPKQFHKNLDSKNIEIYDRIILASPCWFYDITPPLKMFVETMNLPDKDIYFIVTHGGDIGELKSKYTHIDNGNYKGMVDFFNAKKMSSAEINRKVFSMLKD